MDDYTKHHKRVEEVITRTAAEFFVRNVASRALVTVTGCVLEKSNASATVFVSVLPDTATDEVLKELKRLRTDLYEYLRNETKIGNVPRIDIALASTEALVDIEADTI